MREIVPLRAVPQVALPLALALGLAWAAAAAASPRTVSDEEAREKLRFEPIPDWVELVEVEHDVEPLEGATSGLAFLLHDTQVDWSGTVPTSFVRSLRRVTDQEGVSAAAQLQLEFDPMYQTQVIHGAWVHRDGVRSSRLVPEKVELLRRETRLSSEIYDGERTAVLLLEDVRVGDVVEYATSLRGSNPVFEGRQATWFDLQWGVPIHRVRIRARWPADSPPRVKVHQSSVEMERREAGGLLELSKDLSDVPALDIPNGLPSDYSIWPQVQVSEWENWAEVATWGTKLFAFPADLPEELRERLTELEREAQGRADLARRVLRLVQDEIRYVGLEFGPHAFQPTDPAVVHRRRFGDCKDKSVLLVALLRELGFDARPALVNTWAGARVPDWLPNPGAFNHAIVHLTLEGDVFWLDPTVLHERGPLERRHAPDLGWALVLDRDTRELTRVEPRGIGRTRVSETYRSAGLTEPVQLEIVTKFSDGAADYIRSVLAGSTLEELRADYADYYTTVYPGIESSAPLVVEDDEQENLLEVKESYRIRDFWVELENGAGWMAETWALQLDGMLEAAPAGPRKHPLGWSHPQDFEQHAVLHMHDIWSGTSETVEVEGPAFGFSFTTSFRGNVVSLLHRYRTTSHSIAPDELDRHRDAVARAREQLSMEFTTAGETEGLQPADYLNWPVILVGLFALIGFSYAAWRWYRWPIPPRLPSQIDPELSGLGGWLIVPMLMLFVRPFVLLWEVATAAPSYALPTWTWLTSPGGGGYHALWAPLLLFEVVGYAFQAVALVLLTAGFFAKRRFLPVAFAGYLVSVFLISAIVSAGCWIVLPPEEAREQLVQTARLLPSTLLWSIYFLVSRRVKSTFTR